MYKKHKQQGPRLDRRNAIKHIDYNASISSASTSSSFDNQSTHRTRSLDLSPLSERTSFRIEGIEGEFDVICRSLGLSGPEDFAIPASAWEARKSSSPVHFKSSRFRNSPNSEDGLTESFEARTSVNIEAKHENERSELKNGFSLAKAEARVIVSKGVKHEDGDTWIASVRSYRDGESGIKGVRRPVLAPPPGMLPLMVDNLSSTWDIFRDFAPHDDGELSSPVQAGLISNSNEDEENDELDGLIAGKQEPNSMVIRNSTVLSESCSDASNDDNYDDDSFNASTELAYPVSDNGSFRRSIKSWQKGDFLGSGSFGTVHEGYTDDGLFFAVKEVSLLDQGSQGKQSIYQLEQEISLLSQFQHENIVQYLGTDKDDSKLYIFLELVTKGSLANLYQKYHLWDSQVSSYTRQILNGLNYLHDRNVVHRDIKCANILVDVSGSVKLADFGLAKTSKLNDIKSCKGTPFWMAPEVVNNRKIRGYGRAADIWSLGCTVLEMLTSQIPYSHLEGMQALFRIGRGEPPPIPNSLSGDAQDFILKCLQVNPDDRPTATQLLDHPFVKRPLSTFLAPASPHYGGIRS